MLIRTFNGSKIIFPSGSGPIKCKDCGGRGYSTYGPNPKGSFVYWRTCFDCKAEEKVGDWSHLEEPKSVKA